MAMFAPSAEAQAHTCDNAGTPPANGDSGACVDGMADETSCQHTCDAGFFVSGVSVCDSGQSCCPFTGFQPATCDACGDATK
jgi:hypothetical protein